MKSFTLDGKRYRAHPKIPLGHISWLMMHQHVGTTDAEIEKLIEERTKSWPPAAIRSAKRYALYCHRKNQKLVRDLRL